MSPSRKKRSASKPTKKVKKAARRAARKPLARKPARRPKAKSRTRAKAPAKSAKPKRTLGKRGPHSAARANGAPPKRGVHRGEEEPLLEQTHIEEEESVTIGGYDESEDFEEPFTEEEDEYSDDSDEGF